VHDHHDGWHLLILALAMEEALTVGLLRLVLLVDINVFAWLSLLGPGQVTSIDWSQIQRMKQVRIAINQ